MNSLSSLLAHKSEAAEEAEAARLRALKPSFGDYLVREGYSSDFFDLFMGPMFAVICTCSYDSVRRYPAEVIIHYLAGRHGMCSSQRRINGGLKQVTDRMTAPVHRLKMGSPIVGVRQCNDGRGGGAQHGG